MLLQNNVQTKENQGEIMESLIETFKSLKTGEIYFIIVYFFACYCLGSLLKQLTISIYLKLLISILFLIVSLMLFNIMRYKNRHKSKSVIKRT